MGMIALPDWQLYAIGGIALLMFLASIGLFFAIRNNAPDAMTHWTAARTGQKICRVHYRGRKASDYIAHEEKDDKELGASYWSVPGIGLKFKPEPEDIEFIEGTIPCVNYYENMTEPIKLKQAVAFSQLKEYFKKIKMPIDGITDIAFYVSAENEKLSDKQRAINNAKIESGETQIAINKYLDTVEANKKTISEMKIESGLFTWQTAMRSLDSIMAFTSSHFANARETIRAAEKRKLENQSKNIMLFAVVAVILAIAGLILLFGLKQL